MSASPLVNATPPDRSPTAPGQPPVASGRPLAAGAPSLVAEPRRPVLSGVLISVVFGLLAGAVGMLLVSAYVLPAQSPQGASLTVRGRPLSATDISAPSLDPGRAAVLLFDKAAVVGRVVASQAFGAGVTLTSDGWLLAHESSFMPPSGKVRRPQDAVAVVAGKSYPVRLAMTDPYTGIMFLKIDASNLPVTAFDDAASLALGGPAFGFDPNGGVRRLQVNAVDDRAAATSADLVQSSERLQKVVHVSGAEGLLPGAMLLSKNGGVAAVLAGHDAAGAYAIPYDAFSGVIGDMLHDRPNPRPLLGVHYIDLARAIVALPGLSSRGALLAASDDGKLPAVALKSPADAAGLKAGDVIVSVSGEELSAKNGLADVLAEYTPGTVVSLEVSRAGQTLRLDVTLGSATAR